MCNHNQKQCFKNFVTANKINENSRNHLSTSQRVETKVCGRQATIRGEKSYFHYHTKKLVFKISRSLTHLTKLLSCTTTYKKTTKTIFRSQTELKQISVLLKYTLVYTTTLKNSFLKFRDR